MSFNSQSLKYQLQVSSEMAGKRIDVFLCAMLPEYSRNFWQARIKTGDVTVGRDQISTHRKVRVGETVQVTVPPVLKPSVKPQDIPLDILYEDRSLIIINKSRDITVHPCPAVPNGTLVNALVNHSKILSRMNGELRPGIVHRLDRVTSGLLVVAKDDRTHNKLSDQFKARTIEKRYFALVSGAIPNLPCEINAPIGRHPIHRERMTILPTEGREARTIVLSASKFGCISLLDIQICTGRTHQIRVHLKTLGISILNDGMYGVKSDKSISNPLLLKAINQLKGIALHSHLLCFEHPNLKRRMAFRAALPADMNHLIELAGS